MMSRRRFAFAAVSLLIAMSVDHSATAEIRCQNPSFAYDLNTFRPAAVVGDHGARAYFHDLGPKCPTGECRRKSYLIPGDRVLVGAVSDDWACAAFTGGKKPVIGWLRKDQLFIGQAPGPMPLDAWSGQWTAWYNSLDIAVGADQTLAISGTAIWGDGPAPRTGEVNGSTTPSDNRALVKDGSCQVRLTLVDQWLVADDNSECGGMNVTFTGIYRREVKQ